MILLCRFHLRRRSVRGRRNAVPYVMCSRSGLGENVVGTTQEKDVGSKGVGRSERILNGTDARMKKTHKEINRTEMNGTRGNGRGKVDERRN